MLAPHPQRPVTAETLLFFFSGLFLLNSFPVPVKSRSLPHYSFQTQLPLQMGQKQKARVLGLPNHQARYLSLYMNTMCGIYSDAVALPHTLPYLHPWHSLYHSGLALTVFVLAFCNFTAPSRSRRVHAAFEPSTYYIWSYCTLRFFLSPWHNAKIYNKNEKKKKVGFWFHDPINGGR